MNKKNITKYRDLDISSNNRILNSGFTLIEILVVAAIITISFIWLARLQSRIILDKEVNAVVTDLRNLQLKSLSGARYDVNNDGDTIDDIDFVCGYGISPNQPSRNSYIIYTDPALPDCNDRKYNPTGSNPDIPLVTKTLPGTLKFKKFDKSIFFFPPEGKASLKGKDVKPDDPRWVNLVIMVSSNCSSSNPCKTICAYDYGGIDIYSGNVNCPKGIEAD